jgi:ABC-type sugar transport system ATPase subunit
MLRVENLSLTIGEFMLNDVSFQINHGDYFVILGKNGAGKTLLLETIAGLNKIDSGNIFFDDVDSTNQQIQKRNISIVYQDSDLFPHMNVFENIAYPINHEKKTIVQKKVEDVSKKIGIENLLNRKPETLSGGEYQKVSLARSLITGNKLLLLDEPLSALDSSIKAELKMLFKKINREGITIIHVTHDYEEAISLASKIGILENGKLITLVSQKIFFEIQNQNFLQALLD